MQALRAACSASMHTASSSADALPKSAGARATAQVRKPKRRPLPKLAAGAAPVPAAAAQLANASEFGYLAEALEQARKMLAAAAAKQRRGARSRRGGAPQAEPELSIRGACARGWRVMATVLGGTGKGARRGLLHWPVGQPTAAD